MFFLGTKYSEAMNCTYLDETGKPRVMVMGCYGIGVSRIVAAAIEQNHDPHGIVWPGPMSPFDVTLLVLNPKNSEQVTAAAAALYLELQQAGLEVMLDDRDARPGVKFADAELVGIPHLVVVAERGLDAGQLEYRHRRAPENEALPLEGAAAWIRSRLEAG